MHKKKIYNILSIENKILKHKNTFISVFMFLFFSYTYAKESSKTNISLNLTEVSLEVVLSKIESQTNYTFLYQNNAIDLSRAVTIKVKNKPISIVLSRIFNQNKISYQIIKNQIILKKIISQIIKGVVIDETSGKTIPYCSVSLMNSTIRTSTNELGEFEIKTDSLPAKLILSHNSYRKSTITIKNIENTLTVKLTSLEYVLDEIVIKTVAHDKKKDRFAANLVKNAYKKILLASRKNSKTYAKAFYRQKSKNDTDYNEFIEIFFDLHYNTNGIKEWTIVQGRYALKRNSINNKNFTLFSKILKSIQPKVNNIIFPLTPNVEDYYVVNIDRTFILGDDKIAVIKFSPIKGKKMPTNKTQAFASSSDKELPIFEGEAYINTSNYDLLRLNGSIDNDHLKLIRLNEKNATRKNHLLSYEIAFRKDSINPLVIDYIKVDQQFDYYKDEKFITHLSSTSNLTFFEYYTNTSGKKMRRQFNKRYSDWQKLNLIGYDSNFWENNPIIRRTPIEKKVIADFEKQNKFQFIFHH